MADVEVGGTSIYSEVITMTDEECREMHEQDQFDKLLEAIIESGMSTKEVAEKLNIVID